MIILADEAEIKRSTEEVREWFDNIENHYTEWHPDHIYWKWINKHSFEEGAVAEIAEILHGKVHKFRAVVTSADARSVRYRFTGLFFFISGSFSFLPTNSGTLFDAVLYVKGGLLAKLLFGRRIEQLRTHMREEGQFLKKILEERAEI